MTEFIITKDADVISNQQYTAIKDIITKLHNSKIIWNLHGNCFAAADMVSSMLKQSGIENQIVECQLSICKTENNNSSFWLVGYDNFGFNGQVDTHAVVITKESMPILIDLSISQFLTESHPFIVEKVDQLKPENLCDITFDDFRLIYQTKRNIRDPSLYQKTLLEKIKFDVETKNKINLITKILWFTAVFTIINFIANLIIMF